MKGRAFYAVNLLALAGEGLREAQETGDGKLMQDSRQLALRALAMPEIGAFFDSLQLEIGEFEGDADDHPEDVTNDPGVGVAKGTRPASSLDPQVAAIVAKFR